MKIYLLNLILLFGFTSGLGAQDNSTPAYPEENLTLSEVTAHIKFLASDELKGRGTGTPENDVAARYIAEQFRANGLKSPEGATDYFQSVALERRSPAFEAQLTLFSDTLKNEIDMVLLSGDAATVEAPVVYLGYGWQDSESGHDDYAGKDVTGKIVLAKLGMPGRRFGPSAFSASSTKREFAAKNGAVALIELYKGQFPWRGLVGFLSRDRLSIVEASDDSSGGQGIAHFLVNDPDSMYAAKADSVESSSAFLTTSGRPVESVSSRNVVGLIQGSDPEYRDEYVLLMAHYDHLGVRPSRNQADADSIFNGARDNGMGTVALISAAKALGAHPPKRSVLFLAVTGEEVGLLGSRYYVDNPIIPLNQIIFGLNTDTGGVDDSSVVTVVGLERTTAGEAIMAGCARYGLEAIPDPVPDQNLFNRSDNVAFVRKGVPAPTFSPGFREWGPGITNYYHRPQDEADENFNYGYLLNFSKAYAHAARLIADMEVRPLWREGDEYEAAAKELYGME